MTTSTDHIKHPSKLIQKAFKVFTTSHNTIQDSWRIRIGFESQNPICIHLVMRKACEFAQGVYLKFLNLSHPGMQLRRSRSAGGHFNLIGYSYSQTPSGSKESQDMEGPRHELNLWTTKDVQIRFSFIYWNGFIRLQLPEWPNAHPICWSCLILHCQLWINAESTIPSWTQHWILI